RKVAWRPRRFTRIVVKRRKVSGGGFMDNKRISPNRQRKEKIVAELLEKINRAKGFVFTSYQGLTHKQLEGLKKAVKAFDADFVATKNTLIEIAMLNSKHEIRNSKQIKNSNDENLKRPGVSDLKGATATLFLYGDPVMPLKAIAKSIKELSLPSIKFGILDGLQMTGEQLLKLSTLPTRETLLTQLVIGLKSPISGLHRALNWNLQKFVMTLKAIEAKKN
ncbi:MAG: 50S ribosomal protein L10, partial [Candidatus Levybacteria bacterium GW2011_GWB1_37_8]